MPNFNVHPRACPIRGRYRFTHKQIIALMHLVGERNNAGAYRRDRTLFAAWNVIFCMPRYPGPVARLL